MIRFKDYLMHPRQTVDFDPEIGFPEDNENQDTVFDDETDENTPGIPKKLVALALIATAIVSFTLGRESVELGKNTGTKPLPAALAQGGR